jgi:hypothetical protein
MAAKRTTKSYDDTTAAALFELRSDHISEAGTAHMGSGSLYWVFRFPMFLALLASIPHGEQDLRNPPLECREGLFRFPDRRVDLGAIFAFNAASILRLVFFVILRSFPSGAADCPIKPLVPKTGSTSVGDCRV